MADQDQTQPATKPRVRIFRIVVLFIGVIWLLNWMASLNETLGK